MFPPQHTCRGQKAMCGSQLSSSTTWTPGTKLKSSGLLTKTYLVIYWRDFALWEDWAMSILGKITRTNSSSIPPKFTLGMLSLGLLTEQWMGSGQDR